MKLPRWVLGALVCAAIVGVAVGSGCLGPAAVELDVERAEHEFVRYDVALGSAERQTVLTGFLLGGAVADLAVLHVDENDERQLRIHSLVEGAWVPMLDATLRAEASFVDVARVGGRDRLLTYGSGRLSWFDPEIGTELTLVSVACGFEPPRAQEIPHVDVTRDVNGDGRADLVVPDTDGFWVLVQTSEGAFAAPVKIGPTTDLSRIYGADGYRYDPWSQSRIHELDYDHDGRGDLLFWNEDHFEVHTQDERGLFAPLAESFETDVLFDSDDLSSLASGDMTGRVLHSISDLNGDGVGDLVIHSLVGERISKKRSTYEVHLGARTPEGGTTFPSEVWATFQSKDRIQIGMERHDFDGDGQVDLLLTTIEVRFLEGSLWKSLKGFMGDDVWLELEFYRMEAGRFPDQPDAVRRIALDGAPSHKEPGSVPLDIVLRGATHELRKTQTSWPRAFNPHRLLGDVTGDGYDDLLIEESFRGLNLFVGVPGSDLFARRAESVSVIVPGDEEYTWLVDLDQDGKQDIVMHHPFVLRDIHGGRRLPPGAESQRVTILIAR